MRNPFTQKSWSPYLVGVGIGVLSWFAFWSDVRSSLGTGMHQRSRHQRELATRSFELAVLADLLFSGHSDRVPDVLVLFRHCRFGRLPPYKQRTTCRRGTACRVLVLDSVLMNIDYRLVSANEYPPPLSPLAQRQYHE